MDKAWFVWVGDEWGDYVHAETATKAKSMFWQEWASEAEEWIWLGPIRCQWLDGIPITPQNIALGLTREEIDEFGVMLWAPICTCQICKGGGDD